MFPIIDKLFSISEVPSHFNLLSHLQTEFYRIRFRFSFPFSVYFLFNFLKEPSETPNSSSKTEEKKKVNINEAGEPDSSMSIRFQSTQPELSAAISRTIEMGKLLL